MGRWLIHANRGIPNVAFRGELGWTNIYTKIAMRKLDYAKRILQLNENNWTRLIFEYLNILYSKIFVQNGGKKF